MFASERIASSPLRLGIAALNTAAFPVRAENSTRVNRAFSVFPNNFTVASRLASDAMTRSSFCLG